MFEEVVDGAERQPDFPHTRYFRVNLGRSLMLNGRLDAARPLLEAAVDEGEASHDRDIESARRSGRLDEALAQADIAVTAFAKAYPSGHARQGGAASIRALVLRDQGRLDEAAQEFRRAADLLARFNGEDANSTLDAQLQLADVQHRLGKTDEARALHARMTPLLPARFVDGSPVRIQHAELGRRLQADRVVNRS
jgi:tetratricopeptide (TPR) repeat protein